jgi:hypothetical protein
MRTSPSMRSRMLSQRWICMQGVYRWRQDRRARQGMKTQMGRQVARQVCVAGSGVGPCGLVLHVLQNAIIALDLHGGRAR